MTPAGFRPTSKQIDYAAIYLYALAEGAKRTDVVLAPRVGVDPTRISKWRHDPLFSEWLTGVCMKEYKGGIARLLVRSLELGIQGSIEHAKYFAEHSGESPRVGFGGAGDTRVTGVAVQFIGHVIPRPDPLPTAPPLRVPPVPASIPTVAVR